jgi:mevalonate pyrophosphate decarboxylase
MFMISEVNPPVGIKVTCNTTTAITWHGEERDGCLLEGSAEKVTYNRLKEVISQPRNRNRPQTQVSSATTRSDAALAKRASRGWADSKSASPHYPVFLEGFRLLHELHGDVPVIYV